MFRADIRLLTQLTAQQRDRIVARMSFPRGSIRRLIERQHPQAMLCLLYPRGEHLTFWAWAAVIAVYPRFCAMGWTVESQRCQGLARMALAALVEQMGISPRWTFITCSRALHRILTELRYDCRLDGTIRCC